MEKDIFEELNQITEAQELEDYCRGHNDACENKLTEEDASYSYMLGYNSVKKDEKIKDFQNWVRDHKEEVKEHIRSYLQSKH